GMTEGLIFMLFFGLGTLPMFLIASYLGKKLKFGFFQNVNKYVNYSMIVVGLLLILRGSGLNIPYLSPAVSPGGDDIECCH
ncbi:MAG: sulfite exporter TauE/SafE, partial [bacterium]